MTTPDPEPATKPIDQDPPANTVGDVLPRSPEAAPTPPDPVTQPLRLHRKRDA